MGPDGHLKSVSAVNGDRSEFVALHESGPSAAGGEVGARAGGDDGLWLLTLQVYHNVSFNDIVAATAGEISSRPSSSSLPHSFSLLSFSLEQHLYVAAER